MALIIAIKNGSSDAVDTWDLNRIPAPGDVINTNGFAIIYNPDFPLVASVLDVDTVNGVASIYHAPTVTEVQDGVHFGASSSLVGTYGAATTSGTNLEKIRAMLESRLNTLSPALATAWENVPYTPVAGTTTVASVYAAYQALRQHAKEIAAEVLP